MDEYLRNKAAFEFLDYDRDTLFRKNKLHCGIRNIDNSTYLLMQAATSVPPSKYCTTSNGSGREYSGYPKKMPLNF